MEISTKEVMLEIIAERAEGTPYRVTPTPEGFDLGINVADSKWYGPLGASGLKKSVVNHVRIDEQKATFTVTDEHFDLSWSGGVAGTGRPTLGFSGKVERSLGTKREFSFNRTYGISESGEVGEVLAFSFSSEEAHKMIRDAAREIGLKEEMGREARIGLIVAGVTLSLSVVLGLVLAVLGVAGNLN